MKTTIFDIEPFYEGFPEPSHTLACLAVDLKKRGEDVRIVSNSACACEEDAFNLIEKYGQGDAIIFYLSDVTTAFIARTLKKLRLKNVIVTGQTAMFDRAAVKSVLPKNATLHPGFEFSNTHDRFLNSVHDKSLYVPETVSTFLQKSFVHSNICGGRCRFCKRKDAPRKTYAVDANELAVSVRASPYRDVMMFGASFVEYPGWKKILGIKGKLFHRLDVRAQHIWELFPYYETIGGAWFGVERADEFGQTYFDKPLYDKNDFLSALREAPFSATVYFILGIPGDTPRRIKENLIFADKIWKAGGNAWFHSFIPNTGSEIFRESPMPGWWKDFPYSGSELWIVDRNYFNLSKSTVHEVKCVLSRQIL